MRNVLRLTVPSIVVPLSLGAALASCAALQKSTSGQVVGSAFQCAASDEKLSLVLTDQAKVKTWVNSVTTRVSEFQAQAANKEFEAAVQTASGVLAEVTDIVGRMSACL